jgi:hypothetical protein
MSATVINKWNGDEVKLLGKKVIEKSIYDIGLVVEGQAKELAPKNFGYLAASITTQSKTDGTSPDSPSEWARKKIGKDPSLNLKAINKPNNSNDVYVGTAVNYAPYMEFGTLRTDSQAFLRPALRLAMGETLQIVQKESKYYFKDYLK